MSNQEPPRDENGDIIHPDISERLRELSRKSRYTYIFQEWFEDNTDLNRSYFYPVYDKFEEKNFWAFPDLKLVYHQVFKINQTPPPTSDFEKWAKYEHWLNKYFYEVLTTNSFQKKHGLRLDKTHYHISEVTFQKITQLTIDFNIEEHSDFIFFLIASIQGMYLTDIKHHETPNEVKRVKNFPKEIQKLIKALELTEKNYQWDWKKNGNPPELEKVIFKYKNHKPKSYSIEDSHLTSYIANGIKEHWNNGFLNNWKKQLENFPNVYSEIEKNLQYRYRVSKALHNFLIEEKLFKLEEGKKTNDLAVLCIARILEFSHIYCTDINNNVISSYDEFNDGKEKVKKIVRNWIKRKEKLKRGKRIFETKEGEEIFIKETLYKYFDKQLIDSIDCNYEYYDINEVLGVCERFNITHLLSYISHIFKLLNDLHFKFSVQSLQLKEQPHIAPQLDSFIEFIKELKETPDQILNLNIGTTGQKEINIDSPLLLNLIEKSIIEYYDHNQPDYKIDLIKEKDGKYFLNDPSERFLPKFCLSFYNFLLGEVELTQNDNKPSDDFYLIIGLLLQKSNYFDHQMDSEWFISSKAKQWHKLAKKANN